MLKRLVCLLGGLLIIICCIGTATGCFYKQGHNQVFARLQLLTQSLSYSGTDYLTNEGNQSQAEQGRTFKKSSGICNNECRAEIKKSITREILFEIKCQSGLSSQQQVITLVFESSYITFDHLKICAFVSINFCYFHRLMNDVFCVVNDE